MRTVLGDGTNLYSPRTGCVDEQGFVYVVDNGNNRIAVFDSLGALVRAIGSVGTGPDELLGPTDIEWGPSRWLYVADSGNQRVVVFEPSGDPVRQVVIGRSIQSMCVGSQGHIYIWADVPKGAQHLVEELDESGQVLRRIGTIVQSADNQNHVNDALNRVCLALDPYDQVLVALRTLAETRIYGTAGRLLEAFTVRGKEVDIWRRYFYEGHAQSLEQAKLKFSENPSREDLVKEVAAVCSDGQPHGANYINGIVSFDNRIIMLVYGLLYEYSTTGELLRKWVLVDKENEPVISHILWTGGGRDIYVSDMAFDYKCYRFSLPVRQQ